MSSAPPDVEVPSDWARLHPLSPVVRFGNVLLVLAVVAGPRLLAGGQDAVEFAVEAGAVLLGIVAGYVSWRVTRWRVADAVLQVETGLLRRQSTRIPLVRVQAIDVIRPLLARLLGLAELRVVVAGSGSGTGRLAYLPVSEAHLVRARLLALAHGLADDVPEPPEHRLAAVDNARLVAATLIGTPAVLALGLVSLAVLGTVLSGEPVFGASLVPVLVPIGLGAAARVNAEWGLVVAGAPDGLRVRSGLLQTRAETVPQGRIQAVRWKEPLLWRPFGWCRLEVDVARQHGEPEGEGQPLEQALLPVGSYEEARWVLGLVMPGVDPAAPRWCPPPARARLVAPLAYPNLGVWHDDRYVVTGGGWLQRTVVAVPLGKVQSLRLVQGPAGRRLRLATLHLDLVGPNWRAAARRRDEREAAALLAELSDLARAARAERGVVGRAQVPQPGSTPMPPGEPPCG